jgi:hypothetical protein
MKHRTTSSCNDPSLGPGGIAARSPQADAARRREALCPRWFRFCSAPWRLSAWSDGCSVIEEGRAAVEPPRD